MRIKRLDIMGFKSFPERVQVPFAEGVSAVVGPNGCGKSNIVDAIRWVMGEQSPKQLRGRQMDDILFNGAKSHQAAGLAEVTMVLANEPVGGRSTGLGPSEISITRRLYRSGDSEYLINKIPCRLKDITQFFMDTGMGTKAYAIIEQGRIGALVDARPEERRSLIDEAAGITRYKAQKKEAERKIESTEQNLTHINTILAETRRQINSLTRAARKAARYKDLKNELREVDLALAGRELGRLNRQQIDFSAQKEDLEKRQTSLLVSLERLELALEEGRLAILEREKQAEAQAETVGRFQIEYNKLCQEQEFLERQTRENLERSGRVEGELTRLDDQQVEKNTELSGLEDELIKARAEVEIRAEDRDQARQALAELALDFEALQARRDEISRQLSGNRNRQARLEEVQAGHERLDQSQSARREELEVRIQTVDLESARLAEEERGLTEAWEALTIQLEESGTRTSFFRSELNELRIEFENLSARERKADSALAGLASKWQTLKDVKDHFGWYPEGVKALLSSAEACDLNLVGPVAEHIQAPEGFENAVEAALGERLHFILVRDRRAAVGALAFLKKHNLGRAGLIAMDRLGLKEPVGLLQALIGDFVLAENLDEAAGLSADTSVLTREGEYLGPDGLIVGGRAVDNQQGLLSRLREVDELEDQVLNLKAEKEKLVGQVRESADRIRENEAQASRAEEEGRTAQAALTQADKNLSLVKSKTQEHTRRRTEAVRALEALETESRRLALERETSEDEFLQLREEEGEIQGELDYAAEQVRALGGRLEAARQEEKKVTLENGALTERLKAAERETARIREWLGEIKTRMSGLKQDLERCRSEESRLARRQEEIVVELAGCEDTLAQAQKDLNVCKSLVDEARSGQNVREQEARQSRKQRSELDEAARKLDLDLQETVLKRDGLLARLEADYRLDSDQLDALKKPGPGPEDSGFDVKAFSLRREELKKDIEDLGEVNLTAIGEHDALQERFDFFGRQYDDLVASIQNLRNSIARINRTCKVRFQNTFEAVDKKFREIFPLLFEGGEAWLSLTDSQDPLESGVEIHVHPPGKKLTVMSLLSGGEKALVALALIFALYLIKPSPFCLLDETDAPLDEANIDRFNRLLKRLGQSSQIIMVTHNKRTMQIAQVLYGVTMEQPGISKMVSVSLSELEEFKENAQMVQAG